MKKAFKHTNEGVTYGYKGKKYKKLPAGVKTSSGWGTDARDEFGKLKDAITEKLGKTNTKRDGVKVPKGHQDESFIPEGDTKALSPSGLRLGVQELTRVGMGKNEMAEVAKL